MEKSHQICFCKVSNVIHTNCEHTIPFIAACDATSYGANCASNCTCVAANTQTCAATNGACTCKPGWTGATCSDDVDECLAVPPPATPANAECKNTDGSFVFNCNAGYVKAADGTCTGELSFRQPQAKNK